MIHAFKNEMIQILGISVDIVAVAVMVVAFRNQIQKLRNTLTTSNRYGVNKKKKLRQMKFVMAHGSTTTTTTTTAHKTGTNKNLLYGSCADRCCAGQRFFFFVFFFVPYVSIQNDSSKCYCVHKCIHCLECKSFVSLCMQTTVCSKNSTEYTFHKQKRIEGITM